MRTDEPCARQDLEDFALAANIDPILASALELQRIMPCGGNGDAVEPSEACMSDKVGHFDICREMARRGMDIRMSLLENVTNLEYSECNKGTAVTIGVYGNIVGAIGIERKFIGGLLLCDRAQYFAVAEELKGKL